MRLRVTVAEMSDGRGGLDDPLAQRPLVVELERIVERRVRRCAERLNRRLASAGASDPYVVDDGRELARVVMLLCEAALEADEQRSGLAADPLTGELRSREVAEERDRRRCARRAAPPQEG